MLLNTRVREYTLRPRDIAAYGWPYYAVATWNNSWNQCSLNIAKNAFVALYILFLVTLASETWLAWRSAKVNKRTTIMNQAKDFPDRYWPRIFATAFVCVCLLIFNFRQSNDSTEYIFDYSYGWPFRTYTVVNDIFSIRDLGIGTVFWSFSGLFLNLGICFSLLFLTPLGVRQLQRVNGGLCRFHLQTVLIIVLLMGLFLKLNLIQSINQQIWPWGGTANHSGWPYRALYWDTSTDNPGNSVPMIFWGALAKNAFVAGYACFLAWVLSESWLAWRARKKSNQPPT